MTPTPPTKRPTDATHLEDLPDPPTELLNLPWIDVHNHAHTLSWADRERFALAGCEAMVMVASGHHWTPYKPVRADDVRYLWDDAINRRPTIERSHFVETHLAVGVQTGIRVENPEPLVDSMAEYCSLDAVVAVGEIGIRPSQRVSTWSLDEQRWLVERQLAIAADHDLPAILHTPSALKRPDREYRSGYDVPGYETNRSLAREPVIDADRPNLEAVKLDVEAAREVGLPDERVVASHADPENLSYLLDETDCFASFTIGHPWMTGVGAETVADAIDEYGSDRIMVDTDAANVVDSDVFSIKRAIMDLYRFGIDEDAIRQVVLENPREVFGIGN